MNDLVQFLNARFFGPLSSLSQRSKRSFGEASSVHSAIRVQDLDTEVAYHLLINCLAWLHELMSDLVGLNQLSTERYKHFSHHRFARGDAARQANFQHVRRAPRRT
jgi:hypothetical protein